MSLSTLITPGMQHLPTVLNLRGLRPLILEDQKPDDGNGQEDTSADTGTSTDPGSTIDGPGSGDGVVIDDDSKGDGDEGDKGGNDDSYFLAAARKRVARRSSGA